MWVYKEIRILFLSLILSLLFTPIETLTFTRVKRMQEPAMDVGYIEHEAVEEDQRNNK